MKTLLSFATAAIMTCQFLQLGAQAAEPPHHPDAAAPQTRIDTNRATNVGVKEFEKLRSDSTAVVLDVRTPKEYESGHMPGAINIDANSPDFERKVKALDPNKVYLVHCAAGVRSAKACDKLSKLNFTHLYNLEGGMRAWEKAGNKSEK
jgi:rhodanese-related sulfurtransferase